MSHEPDVHQHEGVGDHVRDLRDRADHWVDRHTETDEHRPKYLEDAHPQPTVDELRRQQRREAADSWVGPGFGVATDSQWKGFGVGVLVGGAIGIVLLIPLAFFAWGGLAFGWRLLIAAIVGALGGGTAGAIYLGGRMPELENETMDADGRPGIGSTPRSPGTDRRGR